METRAARGLRIIGFGCFGFSWKSTIRPRSSAVMIPKELPSSRGMGMAATVQSAFCATWKSSIWRTSMR